MSDELFNKLKDQLTLIDPITFIERYLTLDGQPFRVSSGGYKPFADIYRYIGIKALEPNAKPVILVKGRQVGGTTMAGALEMYFMGSGLFGVGDRPPIRIIHAFPLLELAAAYSKTKLNQMISSSIIIGEEDNKGKKNGGKIKSYMQSLLDPTSPTNDSLHFKQFVGGNHIWIESTGIDADRLMGRTADVIFFDECYPLDQLVSTELGPIKIGQLYKYFVENKKLPKVYSFNEETEQFELKKIVHVWKKGIKKLLEIRFNDRIIRCTENHKYLTNKGWIEANKLENGSLIKGFDNKNCNLFVVNNIVNTDNYEEVYDLEVEDNHNFIVCSENGDGPIAHNCQRTTGLAMGNALKILTTAKYGKQTKGVQVYFGTPRRKGSDFHKMWQSSSQQYYYLGCAQCNKHFPLYTPGTDEWEKIWIYGYIVKCPHCGLEQDKREAAERGKWVALRDHNDEDVKMIGFHINQLYMPAFKREDIENEKPGKHPINTERIFHTEVLGEFFQGDTSPITPEEIAEKCADQGRKFKSRISSGEEQLVVLGLDFGLRADVEQLANPDKVKIAGQSYSTAVVLVAKGPGLLSIEFATKFKRNDMESKKGIIDQIMRQYNVQLAVGDIGFSQDLSETLHTIYGDRYLVSRARSKVNNYVTFLKDSFPKEIDFERDYYIRELYEQMKKGQIRFPFGDYEKIAWLIEHCTSMEVKPSISKTGADPVLHYVKGSTPNDGLMALLNAYLAYKFLISQGFTLNVSKQNGNFTDNNKPLILGASIARRI